MFHVQQAGGGWERALAWDPEEHPRHPAGTPEGGQFAPKGISQGALFVSPNTAEDLTFERAYQQIDAPEQRRVQAVLERVARSLDLQASSVRAIGDTREWGAEPSVLSTLTGVKSYEQVRVVGALLGLAFRQKAVIPFVEDPEGPARMYRFTLPSSVSEVRAALDAVGLDFRTVIPRGQETEVVIYDPEASLLGAVKQLGERYGRFSVHTQSGRGEFLGADSRDDAREVFAAVIRDARRSGLLGRRRVGDHRRDAARPGDDPDRRASTARAPNDWQLALPGEWDPEAHPRHPAGTPEGGQFAPKGGVAAAAGAPRPGAPATPRAAPPAPDREPQPIRVQTVEEAYALLTQRQKVILSKPPMVSSLLTKIADEVERARATGGRVTINLCDVSVEGTNIFCEKHKGVSRLQMPQLTGVPRPGSIADRLPKNAQGEVNIGPGFQEAIRRSGLPVIRTEVRASFLKATQKELDGAKVALLMRAIEQGRAPAASIFVSQDNYVIDGHHRWAALVALELRDHRDVDPPVPVVKVGLPILPVLVLAHRYTEAVGMPRSGAFSGPAAKAAREPWDMTVMRFLEQWERALAEWNPEDHPRHPAGTPEGGQFAPKGTGTVQPVRGLVAGPPAGPATDAPAPSRRAVPERGPVPLRPEEEAWVSRIERHPEIQRARRVIQAGVSTAQRYQRAGQWTPERQALHEAIVREILNPQATAPEGQRPTFAMFLGLPGSGKTTNLRPMIPWPATVLDADDVKSRLPEYTGYNAALLHEESVHIVETLALERAARARQNIIFDATGKNGSKYVRLARLARALGYDVEVYYIELDPLESASRVVTRFLDPPQGGPPRFVDPRYVLEDVDGRPHITFRRLKEAGVVSRIVHYDNNVPKGQRPRLVVDQRFDVRELHARPGGRARRVHRGSGGGDLRAFGARAGDRDRELDWNPEDHPRHPAGTPEGGQFAPKGVGTVELGVGDGGRGGQAAPRVFKTPADVAQTVSWGETRWVWKDPATGRPTGALVTGGRPLTKAELPDTLYHVTTRGTAVSRSPLLLGQASAGQASAGLGGGTEAGVSLTSRLEDARLIHRELRRAIEMAKPDFDFRAALDRWAREDAVIGQVPLSVTEGAKRVALDWMDFTLQHQSVPISRASLYHDAYNMYLHERESRAFAHAGGWTRELNRTHPLRNPVLFTSPALLASLDPDDVDIVAVPTANLPDEALVTSGSDDFLHEVRVYADVPLRGSRFLVKDQPHRLAETLWDVRLAALAEWDPEDHPRHPAGTPEGGQFAPKGVGAGPGEWTRSKEVTTLQRQVKQGDVSRGDLRAALDAVWESDDESASRDRALRLMRMIRAEPVKTPPGVTDKVFTVPEGGPAVVTISADGTASVDDAETWVREQDLDTWFPDVEEAFNRDFWKSPDVLYHATRSDALPSILREGLRPASRSRAISNVSVGPAVFTSMSPDGLEAYGDVLLEIDTAAMRRDGIMPRVGQEPGVVERELRGALAAKVGLDDFDMDEEGGVDPSTVIVYGPIPPRYLKVLSGASLTEPGLLRVARLLARGAVRSRWAWRPWRSRWISLLTRYLAEWNPEDHPRHPAGTPEGGQFAPKGMGTAVAVGAAVGEADGGSGEEDEEVEETSWNDLPRSVQQDVERAWRELESDAVMADAIADYRERAVDSARQRLVGDDDVWRELLREATMFEPDPEDPLLRPDGSLAVDLESLVKASTVDDDGKLEVDPLLLRWDLDDPRQGELFPEMPIQQDRLRSRWAAVRDDVLSAWRRGFEVRLESEVERLMERAQEAVFSDVSEVLDDRWADLSNEERMRFAARFGLVDRRERSRPPARERSRPRPAGPLVGKFSPVPESAEAVRADRAASLSIDDRPLYTPDGMQLTDVGAALDSVLRARGATLDDLIDAYTPHVREVGPIRLKIDFSSSWVLIRGRGEGVSFEREIDLKKKVVDHVSLFVTPALQGRGIGGLLSVTADAFYRQIGIKEVLLSAVSHPGNRITGHQMWALQGYTWRYQKTADSIRTAFAASVIRTYGEDSPEAAQVRQLRDRKAPAWEFARFTDRNGNRIGFDLMHLSKLRDASGLEVPRAVEMRRSLQADAPSEEVWRVYAGAVREKLKGKG